MIEFIRGIISHKQPHRLTVNIGGIGLSVAIPFSTFSAIGDEGSEVVLKTHLHWREDGPQLFGFNSEEERSIFRLLTQVNKVGPKLAINILSAVSPVKLAEMIITEDIRGLSSLKGVGPKIASRLVVELKDPISKLGLSEETRTKQVKIDKTIGIPYEKDLREALENLGYTSKEIERAFLETKDTISNLSDLQSILETLLRFFSS